MANNINQDGLKKSSQSRVESLANSNYLSIVPKYRKKKLVFSSELMNGMI